MRLLLDRGTDCLPDDLKACIADQWKRTRVWILQPGSDGLCSGRTAGGKVKKVKATHVQDPTNPGFRFVIICQGTLNDRALPAILLHEMLHACGAGELEAYAIASHCFDDYPIHWEAIADAWKSDSQSKENMVYHDGKWYGEWMVWDCKTGEMWLNSSKGLVKIFPYTVVKTIDGKPYEFTRNARPDPEFFPDDCPVR